MALSCCGDAELLEQLGEIDAARAARRRIDVGHGTGRQQCLLEGLDVGNVGNGRALLDADADADAGQRLGTALDDAAAEERPQYRWRHDDHVEILAVGDALLQRAGRGVLDRHLVAGALLEFGDQLECHRLVGAGGQELEICRGGAADTGKEAENGKDDAHGWFLGGIGGPSDSLRPNVLKRALFLRSASIDSSSSAAARWRETMETPPE